MKHTVTWGNVYLMFNVYGHLVVRCLSANQQTREFQKKGFWVTKRHLKRAVDAEGFASIVKRVSLHFTTSAIKAMLQ